MIEQDKCEGDVDDGGEVKGDELGRGSVCVKDRKGGERYG